MEASLFIFNFDMMEAKQFFKYIICVLLGLGVVDVIFSYAMEIIVKHGYASNLSATYNAESDIAIIGASRAIHHYNPKILSDSLKCDVSVYGAGGQNIYYHNATLNSLLSHSNKKPSLIILELGAIDVNNTPKWNTEKLNSLFPYIYSEPYVRELLSDVLDKNELIALKLSGLYRNNSKILTYLKNVLVRKEEDGTNGYTPLKQVWNEPIKEEKEHGDHLDSMKLRYLVQFIETCKQDSLPLVFSVSPNYKKLSKEHWKEEIKRLSKIYDIPLIDNEQDTLFINHNELFNEPFHLNEKGANMYSIFFSNQLRSIDGIWK